MTKYKQNFKFYKHHQHLRYCFDILLSYLPAITSNLQINNLFTSEPLIHTRKFPFKCTLWLQKKIMNKLLTKPCLNLRQLITLYIGLQSTC